MTDRRYCGAQKRKGGTCERPAGWGTDHAGVGACKLHGGSMRNHNRAAAKQLAVVMGAEADIEPHDALLWCVRIAAGEVSYLSAMVSRLDEDVAVGSPIVELERTNDGAEVVETRRLAPELNIWIRARQEATERLARFSKMALDANISERQVRVAERYGEQIAALLAGVMAELELTAAQQRMAPDIVRRHLVALEGGQAQRLSA